MPEISNRHYFRYIPVLVLVMPPSAAQPRANTMVSHVKHSKDCRVSYLPFVGLYLRVERQRGDGPPWIKITRQVFYPVEGFRAWLKTIERRPARARKAA